jgi:MtN3 and saliva related transmembrane protein
MISIETCIKIIGVCAGVLVIICLIPQLITIIQNKSAKDVSILMYITLFIAQILWFIYGYLISDLQILITNVISAFISGLIIICSVYYNKRLSQQNYNENIIELGH